MRILLVRPKQPGGTNGLKYMMVTEPLELEYVAAGVPQHEVHIHDMLVEGGFEAVLKRFKPHVVGTSCYINAVDEAVKVCREAKRVDPGIRTVIGGVHAVRVPEDFEQPEVDFIVQGEGVVTFRDLIACLDTKADPRDVTGIGVRSNGGFFYTRPRPFPKDVDALPLPNRELTKAHRNEYYYLHHRPLTIMKTSFGCPYKCSFCYNRLLTDGKMYTRSPESVVAELETIDSEQVFIVDDTFLLNRSRLTRMYELIKERGIRKEYLLYGRTDFIAKNKDLMEKWAEIGLRMVRVGLEAATDEELGRLKKNNRLEYNSRAIEVCQEVGIDLSGSFILQPDYTKEDFKRVAQYIKDKGLIYIIVQPLTPLPTTEIFGQYEKEPFVPRQQYELWDFLHCVLKPTGMSLKAFYRRMGFIYLSTLNPFRMRRVKMSRRAPVLTLKGIRFWIGAIKALFYIIFAYRQHKRPVPAAPRAATERLAQRVSAS